MTLYALNKRVINVKMHNMTYMYDISIF